MKKRNVLFSIVMAVMLLVLPTIVLAAEAETVDISLETIQTVVSLPATWITSGGGEEMAALGILYMGSDGDGNVMLQISHKQDEETLEMVKENFASFPGISNLEDIEIGGRQSIRYELSNSVCYLLQLEGGSILGLNFTVLNGEISDDMKATAEAIVNTIREEDAEAEDK